MANLLERYGIKEVADVTFYEIDSKGAPSAPVLYLDTLKVSTIEQSAESTDATGGKGNPPLISWDYGKEINVTLEDALFSVKSLAVMFGGQVDVNDTTQEVLKTVPAAQVKKGTNKLFVTINGTSLYIPNGKALGFKYNGASISNGVQVGIATADGVTAFFDATTGKPNFDFLTFDLLDAVTSDAGSTAQTVKGLEIEIKADQFPGTYYITGDTYARNQVNGQDEFFQFIIPRAKVQPTDLSLTMEAEGDPSTFSMTLKVLRTDSGDMMKLVKYGFGESGTTIKNKGVGSIANTASDPGSPAHEEYETGSQQVADSGTSAATSYDA